jgi:hypothetical protein
LKLKWVPHDLRDQAVDFVRRWSEKTAIPAARLVGWAGLARSKFFDWKSRYGKVNEHNGWIPRDHGWEDWEEKAIIDFHRQNPLEGYRRLTFMMLDADIVAVSPSRVYRVLSQAGRLAIRNGRPSKKGTGCAEHYNTRRLHSAIGYITPADKLAGREKEIFAARDRKLETARQQRQLKRQAARSALAAAAGKSSLTNPIPSESVGPSRETEAGSAEEQPAEG